MDISITSRNFDLDDSAKQYIFKKLSKFGKIYERIFRAEVVLEEEKNRTNIEIILYLKRNRIIAKESSVDLFASIDEAVECVKKQLRRMNGRVKAKRRKSMIRSIMRPMGFMATPEDIAVVPQEEKQIIKMDAYAERPMMPEEAKEELEANNKSFIMFKRVDTGEPNVIYKRSDGKYGLIEPRF